MHTNHSLDGSAGDDELLGVFILHLVAEMDAIVITHMIGDGRLVRPGIVAIASAIAARFPGPVTATLATIGRHFSKILQLGGRRSMRFGDATANAITFTIYDLDKQLSDAKTEIGKLNAQVLNLQARQSLLSRPEANEGDINAAMLRIANLQALCHTQGAVEYFKREEDEVEADVLLAQQMAASRDTFRLRRESFRKMPKDRYDRMIQVLLANNHIKADGNSHLWWQYETGASHSPSGPASSSQPAVPSP